MNRSSLAWALTAALPHAGCPQLPGVGLEASDGELFAYATDKYTISVARIPAWPSWPDLTGSFTANLSVAETRDLIRMVRPQRVAEHDQPVKMLASGDELHVGFADDTAVFETTPAGLSLGVLFHKLRSIHYWPGSDRELAFNPDFTARFAKAKHAGTDVVRFYGKRNMAHQGDGAACLVTVGGDFLGAVAGMQYDDVNPLTGWFPEQEKVTA